MRWRRPPGLRIWHILAGTVAADAFKNEVPKEVLALTLPHDTLRP
jgi:hypothetical protein